jgi:hypothetical protein
VSVGVLSWVDVGPGERLAMAHGRPGRHLMRHIGDDEHHDRWTLTGPQERTPWSAGTRSECEGAAEYVDLHRLGRTTH